MKRNEIEKMSTSEKLQAMEDLWSALLHQKAELKSPDWHEPVISERKEKIERGDASFISLEKLKNYRQQ